MEGKSDFPDIMKHKPAEIKEKGTNSVKVGALSNLFNPLIDNRSVNGLDWFEFEKN